MYVYVCVCACVYVCVLHLWWTEEGFSGLLAGVGPLDTIPPHPVYSGSEDGRADDGAYVFSTQRLDMEGRCVVTDHKVVANTRKRCVQCSSTSVGPLWIAEGEGAE